MKASHSLSLALTFFLSLSLSGQDHSCSKIKQTQAARLIMEQSKIATLSPQISHELKYDVKFVQLNLQLERNINFIKGGVKTVATVTVAVMDTFQTLLHLNHTIDSIRFNGSLVTALRQDSLVKVKPPIAITNGSSFTVTIYYKGNAPSGGSAIGSGYDFGVDGTYGNEVAWSLSESFVAYTWWPCKQILTDKIDSSWVFVTTDSTNKVGSNGRLQNVVTIGNKKRYEWKSRAPIDYYLISVAVAKYKQYNLYAKPQYLFNDSILIQNYVYDNAINDPGWIAGEKVALDKMPNVIKLLSNFYGMYPFYREKYGHCMAPIGGAMEHQTMTTTFGFDFSIDAHEFGHQWWGDNVTCKSWGDIWMNEGFATYTAYLVEQYLDPPSFAPDLYNNHNYIMSQPGGSIFFTGLDTLNTSRIFDGRLTYAKGGSILHTLRFLTNNDSLWFSTLRGFQNTYKNSTASAADFQNYFQTQSGINVIQFFNQWYYGEGFPTFTVKYNFGNGGFYLKSSQSVSMPAVTPLFVTPMEYKIIRTGMQDTTVTLMHNVAVENYSFALNGTVTSVVCDPNNWVINRTFGPTRDFTLGITVTPPVREPENTLDEIKISPNPSTGQLKLIYPHAVEGKIMVCDLFGKCLLQQNLEAETILDISQFSNGCYFLKLIDKHGNASIHKIIKQAE